MTFNSAIVVFREGLEAVLIVFALTAGLQVGEYRKIARLIWIGAGLGVVATVVTWIISETVIQALAPGGEFAEAIVSILAIAVLLVITNWFFHNVYWTDWVASFQRRKRHLLKADISAVVAFLTLGLTSVYREGFESVLFLQALALQSNQVTVAKGVLLGAAGTCVVGVSIQLAKLKLPYRRLLIATGALITIVLVVMVGNTVSVLQNLGWMQTHQIGPELPTWSSEWLGIHATLEGIALQFTSGVFVVASYALARRRQHLELRAASRHLVS